MARRSILNACSFPPLASGTRASGGEGGVGKKEGRRGGHVARLLGNVAVETSPSDGNASPPMSVCPPEDGDNAARHRCGELQRRAALPVRASGRLVPRGGAMPPVICAFCTVL